MQCLPSAPRGLRAPKPRPGARLSRVRGALTLLGLALACGPASAVLTFFDLASPRFIQLQVGASGGTVNTVGFRVTGAHTSPTPQAVPGVPDALAPATTPSGGVRVRLRGQWASGNQTLRLLVDSAAGMACVAGSGCGSTVIPFTTVRWVSHERESAPGYAGWDIQSGGFDGGTAQQLVGMICCFTNRSVEVANTLVFSYGNTTLYPAGRYRGTVTFTAVIE
jgi:hypothetical protein